MEHLDVEFLQKVAYDKSKVWTSFFEKYESNPTVAMLQDMEEDIDIAKVETSFALANDGDLSDDLASMEDDNDDDVETEFLKSATNTSRLSLMIGNNSVDLSFISKTKQEKEYVDVINKTLPILNEHNRQLKEFGFDKVLVSFNKDEIENKFGTWLNRHNSLFGGDNTLIYDAKSKDLGAGKELATYPAKKEEMLYDSDASLQSGETARYIRSSRVGTAKNTTTTMIKTYRMVKKTREKYACESDEDAYHLNAVQVRKNLENVEYQKRYGMTPLTRSSRNERLAFTTRTQRRKVLRKRINNNCCHVNYASSSDSECYENDQKGRRPNLKCCCYKRKHCSAVVYGTPLTASNRNRKIVKARSAMKMSSAFKNRVYYFSRSMATPSSSASSSSSSNSFSSVTKRRRHMKRTAKFINDECLYKAESQCRCYNDKRLCKQFRHVTDTSTEEWQVDYECTPRKQLKTPMAAAQTIKSQPSKSCQGENLQPVSERSYVKSKNNLMENTRKSESEQSEGNIDISDIELKKAIEASKLSFKAEQKERMLRFSAKKNTQLKPTPRSIRKLLKLEEDNISENTAVNTKHLANKSESAAKKSNARKDLTNTLEMNSFFTPSRTKAICNSTALSSAGQAYKRQFADKLQQIIVEEEDDTKSLDDATVINITQDNLKAKSASTRKKYTSTKTSKENSTGNFTVSSTTIRSPVLSLSPAQTVKSTPLHPNENEKTGCEQSDSADVTSTTNAETPEPKATIKTTDKKPQQNHLSKAIGDLTENGILIYAPDYRHTLAASNFTAEGFFTVTQEHLSGIIGEKEAAKFLKFYVGRKLFRLDSMVYYKAPINISLQSSTSSDELDIFSAIGRLVAVTK